MWIDRVGRVFRFFHSFSDIHRWIILSFLMIFADVILMSNELVRVLELEFLDESPSVGLILSFFFILRFNLGCFVGVDWRWMVDFASKFRFKLSGQLDSFSCGASSNPQIGVSTVDAQEVVEILLYKRRPTTDTVNNRIIL